ncbi:MAG TPA: hypothetical protein PLV92_25475, partial [Pirellulaceae bacterium]|nr:hypothetical protein [Pirellulaceae bacterium]
MPNASLSLDIDYRYQHASCLEPNGRRLRLATCGGVTSANGETSPVFFEGQLLRPRLAAEQLRALFKVVQSRFHVPAAMLGRILALADPVVTCHEDRLRWEGFSSCCGAYARVDWLPAALRGETLGRGTTNIDFNPPLLAALASLGTSDRLELTVGQRAVEFRKNDDAAVVEKKVKLPLRWLKGFVEVQSCLSRMQLRFETDGLEARRFFRELPRMKTHRRASYVVPSGRGLRVSQLSESDSGAVRVGGLERLRSLETLAPQAETLRVFGDSATGASAWELDFGDSRFQLAISPEVWRGFSGEGQSLSRLATRA